ncbi:MAG TPA: YidC/Oxa1 family membrane protein insertase [Anaerolineales bacterium]|nr:YidC/Oxa1 family membrane protein insertase [Anaerolineales bacterium]
MDISQIWSLLILNPMINSLLWIYNVLANNFGLAIIVFTILVRLVTYPLTSQQMKSTQKMQDMQKSKQWLDIQKKYKDNKEKLSQEQMKLYKEMGVNPFGSCLPTLIQFPIIIGLYQAINQALPPAPTQLLNFTNHVYPFTNAASLIPLNSYFLWMDLSVPEKDFGIAIAGFTIPILAILVVVSTFFQSKLMTPPSTTGDQGAGMTRAMNLYMPLFMGYLAYSFPSGLALYFVTSNLVGVLQYAAMGKLNWRNLIPARNAPK